MGTPDSPVQPPDEIPEDSGITVDMGLEHTVRTGRAWESHSRTLLFSSSVNERAEVCDSFMVFAIGLSCASSQDRNECCRIKNCCYSAVFTWAVTQSYTSKEREGNNRTIFFICRLIFLLN